MRQGTIQALPALGLTASTGERFNSFKTTAIGKELLDVAFKAYVDQWLHLARAGGEFQRVMDRWLK